MKTSTTEHKTEMKDIQNLLGKDFIDNNKKPSSQWEVTLEEYWLHGMEEDHHKLDQLKKCDG